MAYCITVKDLWMMFNLSREKEERFKEYAINFVRGKLHFDRFWALKDISFKVEEGDSLGIIGLNGSGKSTLLKLVSGIMRPTVGSVKTIGTIAPLIEMGGGFDGQLSAKENIFFSGALHGYSKKYMQERCQKILDFAELGDFADVPLKNFSSGMSARLGFSVATEMDPDILIIDEVLSVGDYKFREKSFERIMSIINNHATVLFVSHSMEQVKKLCKNAIWLDHGHMMMIGPSDEVCDAYSSFYKNVHTTA